MKIDAFEPIPEKDRKGWDSCVKQGRALVAQRDKSIWKLVLLAGRVETRFGEGRIKRFGDEIGLSSRSIYEYRWLNRAGVNSAFVERWGNLSYSLIREILRHTGKVSNPSTEYFLTYASERNVTVMAMRAYMLETVSPDRERERASETIKMALQDKQEAEGFSDYIKTALEQLAESHPELEDAILRTSIVDVEDLEALKVAAGIATDEEEKMIGQARYQVDKIKRYHSHLLTVKADLIRHLEYGHDIASDLRHMLTKLQEVIVDVLKTEQITLDLPAESVEEIEAEIYS